MDISQRLFRLMRTIAEDKFETIGRFIDEGSDFLDERLNAWESEFDFRDEETAANNRQQKQHTQSESVETKINHQLIEDLQLFGLNPPSSLEEVRQIRNQEMKKFHPDRYLNQPEKMETAKKIVQIYNAAYDRLKKSFGSV
jgi:DnaJ-domain-containing protein 1